MSRGRPSQLQLARELAETREQELAVEVGELMRQRASAEATLERLGGYLAEYTASLQGGASEARTLGDIENERRFVKRLSKALDQQRDQAERIAQHTHQTTERWHQVRADLQALDRVVQRREREQALHNGRVEQREADAHGARAARDAAARLEVQA